MIELIAFLITGLIITLLLSVPGYYIAVLLAIVTHDIESKRELKLAFIPYQRWVVWCINYYKGLSE